MGRARTRAVRLEDLDVLGELGRGAQSTVLLVRDRADGRRYALKQLLTEGAGSDRARARVRREARVLERLDHPNLVHVHGSFEDPERILLLVEYVPGASLAAVLRGGRPHPAAALAVLEDVGAGLDSAHQRGVVHRDVKPSNILVSVTGAKLSDFGLATLSPGAAGRPFTVLTRQGAPLGTAPYMSPEAVQGRRHLDHRADVYSFGAVAYELFAGAPPFPGSAGMVAVLTSHLHDDPPPLSTRVPGAPPALDAALGAALRKAPDDRPASAGELVRLVRAALAGVAPDRAALAGLVAASAPPPAAVRPQVARAADPVPVAGPPLPRVPPTLPRLERHHPARTTALCLAGGLVVGAGVAVALLRLLH